MSPASYQTAPPRRSMLPAASRCGQRDAGYPDGDGEGEGVAVLAACWASCTRRWAALISRWYPARSPLRRSCCAVWKCCNAWARSWPTFPVGGGPLGVGVGVGVVWPNDAASAASSDVSIVALPPCTTTTRLSSGIGLALEAWTKIGWT